MQVRILTTLTVIAFILSFSFVMANQNKSMPYKAYYNNLTADAKKEIECLAENIYLNTNENDRKSNQLAVRDYRYAAEMRSRYPLHNYKRSARIMHQLRAIKSPLEVATLQQAIDITEKTFRRLLKFIKPGVWENQIEAEIYHEFMMNRSAGPAYGSIIASGDRARTLHYIANNQQCKNGELILMDLIQSSL